MVRVHKRVLVWPLAGTRICAVGNKVTHGVFHGTVPDRAVPSSVFSEAVQTQRGVPAAVASLFESEGSCCFHFPTLT